ncbi:shikimate dehydrogenase [Schaalia sp. HMT-877]|nr:putative shikimate dehydrogenase [Actinomyces sp. oral taxon 877 str. F0543]WLD79140.1 shikimate dehydrogenase [Schaalia sp. HMT-877]
MLTVPWAAVIGSPIAHSLSPVIHRAAWERLGLAGDWEYRSAEVDRGGLGAFIAGLDPQCRGLSVTMPCKQAVMQLMDVVDPLAATVGAVNTVVPGAGVLTGFNTDVHGITTAIAEARAARGLGPARSACVLGARATASSALAALGALGVTRTTVVARRFSGPGSVVAAAARMGVGIDQVLIRDTARAGAALAADIVVSTLPAGAADPLAALVRPGGHQCLLDVVYAPRDTALRRAFEAGGAVIAEGTEMLIHQGAQQVRLMTGRDPDTGVMRAALEAEVASREGR